MNLKIRLLLGVAAPFVCGLAANAQAQEITTALTAPVSTSTIANGAPANINITSAGSVTLTGQAGATAVTIDSSNTVTNAGTISTVDSSDTRGVRIAPGLTTSYVGNGVISLTEAYERTDADTDGDLDGPLAQGTNRIGLLVSPGAAMTGDIKLNAAGSIVVEGNNSSAISVQSALTGNYSQLSAFTVTGSNSVGLDLRENVTGNVRIGGLSGTAQSGSIGVTGENAIAVRALGDISGEFSIGGVVAATGFSSTTISNYADPDFLTSTDTPIDKRRDADDLLIGGPGVLIRGDLARGFLINGAATGGPDPTTDVKDVIQNYNVNRAAGSVSSFGSAPAVLIAPEAGAAGRALVLSRVRESVQDTTDDDADSNLDEIIATFNYDVGFLNRGTISANGLNIGFAATGLSIAGSTDGAHTTTVEGGVQNTGTIAAQSFEANAVGALFGAGMSTPKLVNSGSITTSAFTETNHSATGVLIQAGASVPSVTNTGSITSSVRGYDGDAVAFRDLSGTVTSFTNSSRIGAGHSDDDTADTITSGLGRNIGIDLSRSSQATTLTQSDTIDNARIFGDVLFGSGADRFDLLSGQVFGDVDFGAGSDTLNITSATLEGDAIFRGAGSVVRLNAGTLSGDLGFGSAAGSLSLTNSSTYQGNIITAAGSSISASIDKSVLFHSGVGTAGFSTLSAANGSEIRFAVNEARLASGLPVYSVAGAATIGAGTVFRPVFTQFPNRAFNIRLLDAGTLNVAGDPSAMLAADLPFLYSIGLTRTGNALDVAMRVKTAGELGLKTFQNGTYDAVVSLLQAESDIGAQLTNISSGDDFRKAYSNLLPVSDAALLNVIATNANAAFGATARRLDLVTDKPPGAGGAWLEEFGVVRNEEASAETLESSVGGFGVAGGVDLISSRNRVLGAFFSFENLKSEDAIRDQSPLNTTQYTLGGYGGWKNGNLAVNGAASLGIVSFRNKRTVEIGDFTDVLSDEWAGLSLNAGGRASYNIPLGFLSARPYISADYTRISQAAHSERSLNDTGAGVTFGDSETSLATASYGAVLAAELGGDRTFSIRPEVSVGWRQVLDYSSDNPISTFRGQTTPFQLAQGADPEDALVAGLGLHVNSEFLNMKVGYDTEITDRAETHYGSITLRMTFW